MQSTGLSLASAESLTGGMVGSTLTAVPHASGVYEGGLVAYASEVKHRWLGVPRGPVVTAPAAQAMARGAARFFGTDVAIATTGVAGPDPQDGRRPGTVFVGAYLRLSGGEATHTAELMLSGARDAVRVGTVVWLLRFLLERLPEQSIGE